MAGANRRRRNRGGGGRQIARSESVRLPSGDQLHPPLHLPSPPLIYEAWNHRATAFYGRGDSRGEEEGGGMSGINPLSVPPRRPLPPSRLPAEASLPPLWAYLSLSSSPPSPLPEMMDDRGFAEGKEKGESGGRGDSISRGGTTKRRKKRGNGLDVHSGWSVSPP